MRNVALPVVHERTYCTRSAGQQEGALRRAQGQKALLQSNGQTAGGLSGIHGGLQPGVKRGLQPAHARCGAAEPGYL